MAVATDADRPPRHIGKAAKKIGTDAKAGKMTRIPRAKKPKAKKKPLVPKDVLEATEVTERASQIIGLESFRIRNLASEKVLYLFTHSENVGAGCLDGVIRLGRYPRLMRWKPGLRFDFLAVVSKPRWDRANDDERIRIVYHALRHIRLDSDGRRGIEPHDHEGFYSEVEFFGLRSPEIKKIAEQIELFARKG